MKYRHLLILILLCCTALLPAQNTPTESSNTSIESLNQQIAAGQESPEIYQALGNAHFQAGASGKAILAYERGLRLQPGNAALQNNLAYVRQKAGIERLDLPDFVLARWWRAAGAFLGAATFFWLAVLFWALAVAGAVTWYLYREGMDEKRRFALLPGAVVCLLLAGLFYSIGNSRNAWLDNDKEVVLTARIADLRVAPGPDATLEKALFQGLKMQVIDKNQGYVKVVLDDGTQGWLPEEKVEAI